MNNTETTALEVPRGSQSAACFEIAIVAMALSVNVLPWYKDCTPVLLPQFARKEECVGATNNKE